MESFNWGELIDGSKDAFAVLPVGTYEVTVDTAEATKSSTDKLMYKIRYRVVEGSKTGSTFFNNVVLTQDNPKAVYMFFQNMEAMGVPREVFKSTPPPSPDMIAQMLVGNRCKVTIDHRKYNGNDVENVTNIQKSTGGSGGAVPGGVPAPSAAPAPSPSPAPAAPAPAPQATTPAAPAAPVQEESTAPIPAPQNPAPPATPEETEQQGQTPEAPKLPF